MRLQEHVPLAPLTTLGVGGEARFFVEASTEKDIEDAIAFARHHTLPLFTLGGGSNVLVPDSGVDGVVLKMNFRDIQIHEQSESVLIDAGAGISWEDMVNEAGVRGIFGIENLAGIPGSLGGAAVQNIGAYGAELSTMFSYADAIDSTTGVKRRVSNVEAAFAYRTSFFKTHPELIITRVALELRKDTRPNLTYADIVRVREAHIPLSTPAEIAEAVRVIRGYKFPKPEKGGSAGSFFKNPVITAELSASLTKRFPGLPTFLQKNGLVKVPLAWILDRVLSLKGYEKGPVRLYEEQPLVIVTQNGATAENIDALAREVSARVLEATGIAIEREVETFGARA